MPTAFKCTSDDTLKCECWKGNSRKVQAFFFLIFGSQARDISSKWSNFAVTQDVGCLYLHDNSLAVSLV